MDNGNPTRKDGGVDAGAVDTLILTYDRATDHLDIGGHCNSLDLMLDMLGRAKRSLESTWRAQRALELQQQLAEQARAAAIAASVKDNLRA